MRWLSLVHPNLLRMLSPVELDDAPPQDTGGRQEASPGENGIVLRKDALTRRLPREIISEILVLACDVDNTGAATYLNATLTPLCLSHVSKLWRDVATSTPKLWKHLQVVVKRADLNSALELVRLWVPRCKYLPLKIDVSFRDEHGPFILYPEDSLDLFRVVTKTSVLLKTGLGCGLDKAFFETHVKAGSSGSLPFVEEKYLWYYGADGAPSKEDVAKLPLVIQGIRRTIDEFGIGYHDPLNGSLTRLELLDSNGITCVSTMELLIILGEFRQLRYLSAHLDHGDASPTEEVVAPNLLTFKLSWPYTTDPGELFDNLSLPRVKEMELSGEVPAGAAWNNLYSFFERNRSPLATLACENIDATWAVTHLADCLALCDNLESLWLENCIVDDEFIASLGRRNVLTQNSVLSRLHTFGLVSAEDVTGDCLVQTLRNADTSNLNGIFVFDCDMVLQEHCDAIEALFGGKELADIIVTPGEPFS